MTTELANIHEARRAVNRLGKAAESAKEKLSGAVETGFGAALSSLSAFGLGVIRTRVEPSHQDVLGVPLPMIIGAAGHLAAIWVDGGASPYLHAVGNGGLAAYFYETGRGVGRDMRAKRGLAPVTMAGEEAGGQGLDDERLLQMARRRG